MVHNYEWPKPKNPVINDFEVNLREILMEFFGQIKMRGSSLLPIITSGPALASAKERLNERE
jgi:hypothetical protein